MSNVQWMLWMLNFHHPVRQCQMTNREGACPPLTYLQKWKSCFRTFQKTCGSHSRYRLEIFLDDITEMDGFIRLWFILFFFLFLTTSIPIMLVNSICEFVEINRCQRNHPARLLCSFSSPPPVHPPLHQSILHPSLLLISLILFLLFLPFLYLPFFLNLMILLLQLLLHPFTSFSYQMEIYVRFDYLPG